MTRRRDPALCTATHRGDPDRPRAAADGINLCGGCHAALGRHLNELPALVLDVLDQLPARNDSAGPAVSGSREAPLPYNPRAGDLLGQMRHDLGWLVAMVAAERGLAVAPGPNPAVQCAWLVKHVDWLAARPDAGAYKGVISELMGRAYSVIDPARLPVYVGPCVEIVDNELCVGVLFATVRREGDPRASEIFCDACTLVLDPAQWNKFGRRYAKTRARLAG